MKDTETFIDKTNNVKNIEKVNIPKADNDPETKVDPRIVLESVQKTVHAVARFAGRRVAPPPFAPRDMATIPVFAPGGLFEGPSLCVPESASTWHLLY